jgi:hypothetical protein
MLGRLSKLTILGEWVNSDQRRFRFFEHLQGMAADLSLKDGGPMRMIWLDMVLLVALHFVSKDIPYAFAR